MKKPTEKDVWIEKRLEEYAQRFGLCSHGGTCRCAGELKFIRKILVEQKNTIINEWVYLKALRGAMQKLAQIASPEYTGKYEAKYARKTASDAIVEINKFISEQRHV